MVSKDVSSIGTLVWMAFAFEVVCAEAKVTTRIERINNRFFMTELCASDFLNANLQLFHVFLCSNAIKSIFTDRSRPVPTSKQ